MMKSDKERGSRTSICEILKAKLASAKTLAHTGTTSAGARMTHDVAESREASTAAAEHGPLAGRRSLPNATGLQREAGLPAALGGNLA